MQTYTIKELRDNLAEIIARVSITGEPVVVTKFGKPKVRIVVDGGKEEVKKEREAKKKRLTQALEESSGIWADREDMKDPEEWVRKIRAPRFVLE